MIKEKRKNYIDGLKCLAIFIIFEAHFAAYFESDSIRFWSEPTMSFLMRGMTAKFGVAILRYVWDILRMSQERKTQVSILQDVISIFLFQGCLSIL